jgi:hypothetical protein
VGALLVSTATDEDPQSFELYTTVCIPGDSTWWALPLYARVTPWGEEFIAKKREPGESLDATLIRIHRQDGIIGPLKWFSRVESLVNDKKGLEFAQDIVGKVLTVINIALMLLSCKNIGLEHHKPSVALNKKRRAKNKQPLFTYHTLVLKPVGRKQESIPKHLWNNRVHLQRGHFKTYTAEKPLFGRITGRFWWEPQVRGRNHEGIVMKDYQLSTPTASIESESTL